MAVSEIIIQKKIEDLMKALTKVKPEKVPSEFASGLASIIKDAILSSTVIVPSGIPVTTAGTAVAQSGATTAPATASIK